MASKILAFISLLAVFSPGCTDTNIYHQGIAPKVPDKISISGRVCTDDPAQRQFPVRIMFIVDTSGSMAENDPNTRRRFAVEDVIDRYKTASNYTFAIVKFAGKAIQLTEEGYTKNQVALREATASLAIIDPCEEGSCRDWMGAISLAGSIFTGDVLTTNPGTLSRTRYVFIFLVNGSPDPPIPVDPNNGCDEKCRLVKQVTGLVDFGKKNGVADVSFHTVQLDDKPGTCQGMADRNCSSTAPCPVNCAGDEKCLDPEQRCTDDPTVTCTAHSDCGSTCEYLKVCNNDNSKICQIDKHCCPTLACNDPNGATNDYTYELLKAMATAGMGSSLRFVKGDQVNFGALNYESRSTIFLKKAFIVSNLNAKAQAGKLLPDSDMDGMSDQEENCYGEILSGICSDYSRCNCTKDTWNKNTNPGGTDTDPAKADTDGDGISDMVEMLFSTVNLDPLRMDIPDACVELTRPYGDKDADGLNDCEEKILGTDPSLFDTDKDGYPDRLEFLYGTNYLESDNLKDLDRDGLNNGSELEMHLDPWADDVSSRSGMAYKYDITDEGLKMVPFSSQPYKLTGVRVTDVSSRSPTGLGVLCYYPDPRALTWQAPGDGQSGKKVALTGSGKYLLYSTCTCVKDCAVACSTGEWCNPASGTCVPDKCTHTTCLSTEKCVPISGMCRPDCTKAECGLGTRCDLILGSCLPDRCMNVDCSSGQRCDAEAGVCSGPPCQGATCPAGMRIENDIKPAWVTVEVDDNLLPKDGFWCDGEPDDPPCTSQADCKNGGICRIRETIRVGVSEKNCISFKVKNITLMETLDLGFGPGHNNIYVYFAQTPDGNPNAYAIFRAALIPIVYHDGKKTPNWNDVPLTDADFFPIEEK